MKLDLSLLKKAINALNRALNEYDKNPSEFVKDLKWTEKLNQ